MRFLTKPIGITLLLASSAAGGQSWELVGRTYNSAGFIDRSRIVSANGVKLVALVRLSTQPAADGWKQVEQQVAIDCPAGMIEDRGSTLLDLHGGREHHPGAFKSKVSATTALHRSLFDAVCNGKTGREIADPNAWVRAHRPSG